MADIESPPNRTPAPERPAERVRWLERGRIRRTARAAARRGEPALDFLLGERVSLSERDAFFAERDVWIAELRLRAARSMARPLSDLRVVEAGLAPLREQSDTLKAAVEQLRTEDPAVDVALGAAEGRTPDSIVLARRRRRHAARLSDAAVAAEQSRLSYEAALENAERLQAQVRQIATEYLAHVRHTAHLATWKRDLFDMALVRHHPTRGLLDQLLDRTVPPLPSDLVVGLEPGLAS